MKKFIFNPGDEKQRMFLNVLNIFFSRHKDKLGKDFCFANISSTVHHFTAFTSFSVFELCKDSREPKVDIKCLIAVSSDIEVD